MPIRTAIYPKVVAESLPKIALPFNAIAFCLTASIASAPLSSNAIAAQVTTASGIEARQPTNESQNARTNTGPSIPDHFAKAKLALDGYCPVSIIDERKWTQGSEEFSVILDGKKYLFPDEPHQQKFLKNTTRYTPALSGDCIVSFAEGKLRRPGKLSATAIHKGRLFLFHSAEEKSIFMDRPEDFEDIDLAIEGICSVCFVDLRQRTPGREEHGTIVGGFRFYFSDAEHRKMFLKNKARYVAAVMQSR